MKLTKTTLRRILLLSLALPILMAANTATAAMDDRRAILVTGANSGIGNNIARRLAREGFYVYAGARKAADIEALSKFPNMEGIRLDVTIQEDIDAAVRAIQSSGKGLYGVVNNAGVVVMGIMAETPESELDFVFDVNVYGPYRIVKAFTPMLIEAKGRIVNISSMAGIQAAPAFGVYSMSKRAIESFTESLIFEMSTVGVHASVVEPGPYKSNAIASTCKRRDTQGYDPSGSLFPDIANSLATVCDDGKFPQFPEPDAVADAVLHALSADIPKDRYLAVTDKRHAERLLRSVAKQLVELNSNGHELGLSDEELHNMLDDALRPEEGD